jgi:predicted amidohydrolase
MLAVDGSGATVAYRKLWLGAAEAERFIPGGKPAVLEVNGWRLGLAICRDTGIQQHSSDTAALGIDAYVAGVRGRPAGRSRRSCAAPRSASGCPA